MALSTLLKWTTMILLTIALMGERTVTRVAVAQANAWHVITDGDPATAGPDPAVNTVNLLQSGSATNLTATLTSPWSSFFGGHGHTNGIRSLADSGGNLWVAFTTTAADIPTTADALDPTHSGNGDIVIARFSAEGDLLYSTYFGGAYDDVVSSIALDDDGNIYLTGHTFSADFPTTANALSHVLQGGRDAIVVKLDATGQLVYSTFLGGNNWDYGFTIVVDAQHDIYVGGFTHGSFPVTPGVAQFNFGGYGDGFVAKLHPTPVGTTLVFATYLGGNSWEAVSALAVDENGYMYLALGTHSTNFPTTPGAFDRVCDNCATNIKTDGAIVKLNPDASQLVYSTLFGSNTATTGSSGFSGIAIDDAGNAYVTGQTTYTDMPVTPDAFQPTYGGGNYDGMLVKINASGSQLLYSTYFGGNGDDRVSDYNALARDGQGNLYFAGRTSSTNFPILNPIQSSLSGGYDAYLASFDVESHLRLSTYWGGSQDDGDPTDVTVDAQANVYLAGATISPDFPTTPNAFDLTINGTDQNGFVTKFTVANNALGTWHVATNGSDVTGTGSEAKPFSTIQHGIDTASQGDTVMVHPGVYRENINFNGKNITVGSLFVTTGDEGYILQTVIDGNRNGHVVTFANGETASANLNGVTVTNGYAHGVPAPGTHGGGVFCNYSSPTLTHLRVTFNEATNEGGGLYFGNCSPTVQDVTVTNNLAGSGGGGIRYSGGSVSLENVVVTHNSARLAGSGIQFYHAEGTIKNALIADNFAGGQGGGLHFDGCSPSFINVTVVGNWTAGHGGGLNVSYMSQPTLVNSIVWGNTPEQIYFDTQWPGEAVTIEYSDIQDGLAGIVTNGQGPVYWGNGNLDASPRFVDVGLGNYHLANDSPGISAGKVAGAPNTDIESNPRPNPAGSNPDLGAYENPLGSTVSCLKVFLPTISSSLSEAPWAVTPGIDLQFPRMRHTATRLLDGKILVIGGSQATDDFLAAVERFDPATGLSSQAASLHTPRHQHTATLLPDGRVLVVGGYSLPRQWLNDAEVYDPVADTWTVVSPPHSHGVEHTATLMQDGRVLVVGGCIGSSLCTDRVDVFNYQTNAWSEAMPLPSDRASHMAELLSDGRVLVAGGGRGVDNVPLGGDELLYNPQTNTWTPTGPMVTRRLAAQAVRLSDGRVLVTGGLSTEDPSAPVLSASTEVYDPTTNLWTSTADLSQVRYQHELVLLEDGQAMAVGGVRDPEHSWTESSFIREIEIYDPAANCWRIVGNLPQPGANATATLLPDDRVWVTGGRYMGTHWSDTWLIGVQAPAPLRTWHDFEGK